MPTSPKKKKKVVRPMGRWGMIGDHWYYLAISPEEISPVEIMWAPMTRRKARRKTT